MKIQINGKAIELKNTFRSLMIYETITEELFNPKNISDFIIYFYSTVLASDKQLHITLDDFTEWLDNNTNELANFMQWVALVNGKNGYINGNTNNKTTEEPKKD